MSHMETSETPKSDCRCRECEGVHSEFISHFGRWPNMSHADAMDLKQQRIDNEASWNRALR